MKDDPNFMERISLDLAARKVACGILDVAEDADKEQIKRAYAVAYTKVSLTSRVPRKRR